MGKKVYVLLADGFEEIETMAPVDILRRAGIEVYTVSIKEEFVISAHNVKVKADKLLKDSEILDGDMVILPGGYPGYENLGNCEKVGEILNYYYKNNKYIGAICGAPTVLAKFLDLSREKITCHSGALEKLGEWKKSYVSKNIIVSNKIITSVGAGHAIKFGLELLTQLTDSKKTEEVMVQLELY